MPPTPPIALRRFDRTFALAAAVLAGTAFGGCERRATPGPAPTTAPSESAASAAGATPVVTGSPASPETPTSAVTNSGGISSGMSGVQAPGPASGASR